VLEYWSIGRQASLQHFNTPSMMETSVLQYDDLVREFHKRRLLYEMFTRRLYHLLGDLLEQSSVPIDHIARRVKTLESFLEKIERKKYYEHPFHQITDIAGIRIVTYYQDHIEQVRDLLQREFTIDADQSVDKSADLEADRFGYRSLHVIISLSQDRTALAEWQEFQGMVAEIQIRSILQHAWAVFSRQFDYKVPSFAPDKVRRELYSLSARLESADNDFSRLRDEITAITQAYREEVTRGQLDIPLALESLKQFIEQHITPQTWAEIGFQAGMEALPQVLNRFSNPQLRALLQTLHAANITTLAQCEYVLQELESQIPWLERFVKAVHAKGEQVYAVPVDVLILLISFARRTQIQPDFDWGGKYEAFFIEALREVIEHEESVG
jgi:putative GTP pyrophosphokinase